ncbi:MAG TPA: hypothetical protein VIP77_03690 [Jiangellaceae bacterium]
MTDIEIPKTWVPSACALPSAEQPLRVAEFEQLFATSVRTIERPRADRLVLVLEPTSEATARDLAARETACCSFFDFTFASAAGGDVRLSVGVPAGRAGILDALAQRAAAASGVATS